MMVIWLVGWGGFDGSGYWCGGPVIVQPHPSKSSNLDGSFDGNYLGVAELTSTIQSVIEQFKSFRGPPSFQLFNQINKRAYNR